MATVGTFCFDGANFAQATSLYTDSALTNLAPDGYYAQGTISRRQLNGVLLASAACSSCVPPCGTGVATSVSNNGLFSSQFGLGEDVGAVIIYLYAYAQLPDGILATYNNTTYNRLTFTDNDGTVVTDGSTYSGQNNQGTGLPTYVGSTNANLIAQSPYNLVPGASCVASQQLRNFTFDGSTYVDQGTSVTKTVVAAQLGTTASGFNRVFTMVIPKTAATPAILGLEIYAPLCSTQFDYNLYCPALLTSFSASAEQLNASCAAEVATYYFAKNATIVSGAIVPDFNPFPAEGNFVFTTNTGSNYLNDTSTDKFYILNNSTYIKVRHGVVIQTGNCL
tara:strand:+ start:663 stop:1670 length:1008 start_codon:yes stop_codon:yes gene_type:complete